MINCDLLSCLQVVLFAVPVSVKEPDVVSLTQAKQKTVNSKNITETRGKKTKSNNVRLVGENEALVRYEGHLIRVQNRQSDKEALFYSIEIIYNP